MTNCCYKLLENPANTKDKATQDLICQLLGVFVQRYNHSLSELQNTSGPFSFLLFQGCWSDGVLDVCGNGACAHYVMVSTFQWKPFWLATQRNPQNDWTATQNRVNYDVFAQAPSLRQLRVLFVCVNTHSISLSLSLTHTHKHMRVRTHTRTHPSLHVLSAWFRCWLESRPTLTTHR